MDRQPSGATDFGFFRSLVAKLSYLALSLGRDFTLKWGYSAVGQGASRTSFQQDAVSDPALDGVAQRLSDRYNRCR